MIDVPAHFRFVVNTPGSSVELRLRTSAYSLLATPSLCDWIRRSVQVKVGRRRSKRKKADPLEKQFTLSLQQQRGVIRGPCAVLNHLDYEEMKSCDNLSRM